MRTLIVDHREHFPLTRHNLAALDCATLSHIRAFTLVFDELWGEGKKETLALRHTWPTKADARAPKHFTHAASPRVP
ncbi:MAG: hypothetical protein WBH00_02550, partial [Xanthobacteraceae bacterium]